MDAQNAAESDPPRHAGASPQQQDKQHLRPRQGSGSEPAPKASAGVREPSPSKDSKDAKDTADTKDAKEVKSNPAANQSSSVSSSSSATAARNDDASSADRDSDAETIVLPGKDGHSPSKVRKVRQEDKSESDGDAGKNIRRVMAAGNHVDKNAAGSRSVDGVKKRLSGSVEKDRQHRNKDGASSGLSSAPASPPHNHGQRRQSQHQTHRRRRSDAAAASFSDSDGSHHKPSSSSLREKLKSGERLLPHKRKLPKAESDDEADQRKARRQRTTSASLDNGSASKDLKSASLKPSQHDTRNRSISPHQRLHRRSASTQLPSQYSGSLKKKRLPPPLQSTEYHSDESSASGSPHPRTAKLRSLATPATSESHASPVKMPPHKKHLDAHGQTFLARACARGEYESVKRRLSDRPEDLNVADYAGNTPLQIAAINGCEDIVKLLIDAGCNLDCVNYDKETPLLDAVDNGHIGVVKLLLEAGVNPRKANVNGEEPIDRVTEDTENGGEIRSLLTAARKRQGERRRSSEDRGSHADNPDARDSHAPDSPRHSPAATAAGSARRSGTVRSTKTRNDLLYMPLDDKTLRQAAGRGDTETVARVLQVKEGFDDPESMVAAARGGHDLVIELLLGLGGANADPAPAKGLPAEFATPILAAIGQENLKVVQLLLEQQNFDPTRRFKGETYYEIARRRQGTNWKEEEHMLKNSYDEWKRNHKDAPKTKSPGRREREKEREEKRARRDESKDDSRPQKRNASSPSREAKKPTLKVENSLKEKRRSESFTSHVDENSQKRGPGRPKKEERSSNASDREISPSLSHKPPKQKRTESDATGMSSDGEAVKPRRKLISKGELKGERERQKRGSLPSNTLNAKEQPSSPSELRNEEPAEKQKLSEKYHDRTKALKRDDSRDRLSVSSDGAVKRHRTSVTPDRPSDADKDVGEAPIKRRRLDNDGQEKRQKRPVSEEGKPRKTSLSRDGSTKASTTAARKARDEDSKGNQEDRDSHRKEARVASSTDKSIRVKQEDDDTDMLDADQVKEHTESQDRKTREVEEEQAKKKELAEREEARKEEERKRVKAEEKKKREQEEARQREEEEKKRKEQEERQLQKKREEEEEARKRREQAEREKREAEEAARRQEEEKRRLEELEREKKEEEEKKRKEEEEARKKKEEEERKQREEEERLHREQLEREAAEEARRQREEEERKERERRERERLHREELERKRALREAEIQRARLEKLPPLLRWLCTTPNPKTTAVAEKLKFMHGARYDTIRPEANNTPEGREQWVLNTHVALLLGEKDLELSRYTAWERVPASPLAKLSLWRTEWTRYSLVAEKLWELGKELPGYYGDDAPCNMSLNNKERLKEEAWNKFLNTNMFFVKVSDFMYTVPNIPHLRGIKLGVEYCELMETSEQSIGWKVSQKWKQDPDASRYHGFAPRFKYYINGTLAGEEMPTRHQTSKTPFPEARVPRRGLIRVYPEDPDYTRLCLEQGLEYLIKGAQSPSPLLNGIHSSPTSQTSPPAKPVINGTNGHVVPEPTKEEPATTNGNTPHGLNGTSS